MVIELFLIGVGLSMDAFAVSVCKGLGMEKINKKHAFLIGLYFGGFQALMPFLGWALGIRFQKYITSVDHWIAFFLLLFIGGKMVIEAVRDKDVQEIGAKDLPLDHKEMLLLAVATSIDALAVGITFAFLNVSIMEACLIIGCTTFVLSVIGVVVGNFFGTRYKRKAEIAGGVILMIFLSAPSPYASDPSPTYISENDRVSTEFFQPHQYRYTRIRQSPASGTGKFQAQQVESRFPTLLRQGCTHQTLYHRRNQTRH